MARESIQYVLLRNALANITDNHTINAYKTDVKLFAAYCRGQGIKTPQEVQSRAVELLQSYEQMLEKRYTPATIHRRLAAPCKGLGINMSAIEKPKRTAEKIRRSRSVSANKQGKCEQRDKKYERLVVFQEVIGLRRAEVGRLCGRDLRKDESGQWCIYVARGKGGKEQMQRILPQDLARVQAVFAGVGEHQKLFTTRELSNHIDLHGLRRRCAQRAYQYYADRLRREPEYRMVALKELAARYKKYHKCTDAAVNRWLRTCADRAPYVVRGANRKKAEMSGKAVVYDRLALMLVSVYHLSHWRLDVTVTNYIV